MASGSPDWQSIVRTHGPMAFETAWRLLGNMADTEDAVQEALMGAFRLQERRLVANWGGLLRHLAARRAIDKLRKRRWTVPLSDGPYQVEPPSPASQQPELLAIERELAEALRAAVADLPDRQSSVFSLFYFGEMDNNAIAETLKISTDAVAVALHKARQRLKARLDLRKPVSRRAES
jgi:RNA polymerase sigma-70 factor (ECF subfamily)